MTKKNHQTSSSEKAKEDWMNSKWRPACGWMYIVVCLFDFMIAPILWSITQALFNGGVNVQWQPLTLQGAGLFHVAMGAIIGVSAYGRTQEKLGGANNGGIALPTNAGTTYTPPAPVAQSNPGMFGAPTSTAFNQSRESQSLGGGSSFGGAPSFTSFGGPTGFENPTAVNAEVVTGWGGKSAPVIPPFPER
jgi:hypothetical protein